ncbi:winged helix-turn-helix domain-containing protein [Chloroflexota bacterium]
MRVNRRRSDIEIIANMLEVGENGAGKTEIMYSANMSYSQTQKYLGYLMGQGFINRIEVGNPLVTYKATDSGLKLLQLITSIKHMLSLEDDGNF